MSKFLATIVAWRPPCAPHHVPQRRQLLCLHVGGAGSPKVRGQALQPLHYGCLVASPRDLVTFLSSMLHPLALLVTGQCLLGL